MKLMSDEKRGSVDCNGGLILIEGNKWCGLGGYYSTKEAKSYNSIDLENIDFGIKIKEILEKSVNLLYSKKAMEFIRLENNEDWKQQFEFLKMNYGYKTEQSFSKNMMHCTLVKKDEKLKISPWERVRNGWDGLDEKYDITLKSDVIPELLGATVRFAFTRCRGKGLDVVTKALFPNGVPNSLEEYLESVDPDYKQWLISV
ncbi:MAG: CdiI family contact-dependent growth inhibition immunity protein [Holosporales bacterium]|jgi:hypothetical protein|nr:CdiI family contact-dependent growth inhibition immunity protein [Holosporales bacterium]